MEAGVKAWREGGIETFGQLISQSGHSSIHLYESGSDELRTMYEIMNRTKGSMAADSAVPDLKAAVWR